MLRWDIDISYFEAWTKWLDGERLDGLKMYGLQILWWGRIGKIVGLISALAIVAEILGAERLRSFGTSMRTQTLAVGARTRAIRTFKWLGWFWTAYLAGSLAHYRQSETDAASHRQLEKEASEEAGKFPIDGVNGTLTLAFVAYYAIQAWLERGLVAGLVVGIFAAVFGYLLLAPLALLTVNVVLMISISLVDFLAVRPVAWVLEQHQVDKLIKIGSVVLLVAGFHLDLLAS